MSLHELFHDLMTNPRQKRLVVMPLTRLMIDQPFTINGFYFFPAETIDLALLRPVPNETINMSGGLSKVVTFEGQSLREVATSLTGFDIEKLSTSPLVAFTEEMDWERFLGANHDDDISLLKLLSSKADRALDIIRLLFCRLDLPDTLPGQIGSWSGSGEYLGALLYSPEDNESYLIAGAAVESSAIVRGLGLQLDSDPYLELPSPDDGDVAGIVLHGLSLYSDALNSSNETIKFIRVMTLFEFLASPDEYQSWKKLKGDIACHCADGKEKYLAVCKRFRSLTSKKNEFGKEVGLRTLIVHHGKLLPEILPIAKERNLLFHELQGYCLRVLKDMLSNAELSWNEYIDRRRQIKRALGVD